MNKKLYELLSCIKQRYTETNGHHAFQVEEAGPHVSARQFYLRALEDNLVRPMDKLHVEEYSYGSGNELENKMKALRSSSAMTFNILGNRHREVKASDNLFTSCNYEIDYEYQLSTLTQGMPANLDAFLLGNDGDIIACEMKMLEWLTSIPNKLKDKYLDASKYIFKDSASTFVDIASSLNTSSAFPCYDFAQMFKHTLALYNALRRKDVETSKLTLLNCVWEPPENYDVSHETCEWIVKLSQQEHFGFQEFKKLMNPVEDLIANQLGINFKIEYLTASELISRLKYSNDELALLKRYI